MESIKNFKNIYEKFPPKDERSVVSTAAKGKCCFYFSQKPLSAEAINLHLPLQLWTECGEDKMNGTRIVNSHEAAAKVKCVAQIVSHDYKQPLSSSSEICADN